MAVSRRSLFGLLAAAPAAAVGLAAASAKAETVALTLTIDDSAFREGLKKIQADAVAGARAALTEPSHMVDVKYRFVGCTEEEFRADAARFHEAAGCSEPMTVTVEKIGPGRYRIC